MPMKRQIRADLHTEMVVVKRTSNLPLKMGLTLYDRGGTTEEKP